MEKVNLEDCIKISELNYVDKEFDFNFNQFKKKWVEDDGTIIKQPIVFNGKTFYPDKDGNFSFVKQQYLNEKIALEKAKIELDIKKNLRLKFFKFLKELDLIGFSDDFFENLNKH